MDGCGAGARRGFCPQPSQCRRAMGPAALPRSTSRCLAVQPKRARGTPGRIYPSPTFAGAGRNDPTARDPCHLTCPDPCRPQARSPTARAASCYPASRFPRSADRPRRRTRQNAQRARAEVPLAMPASSLSRARCESANRWTDCRLLLGRAAADRGDGWLSVASRPGRVRGRPHPRSRATRSWI